MKILRPGPWFSARTDRSELQLHGELQLSGAGRSIRAANLSRGLAERRIVDKLIRLLEVGVVQNVVELGTELQAHALRKFCVLGHDHVPALEAWSIKAVAADSSGTSKQGESEQARVWTGYRQSRLERNVGRVGSVGRPLLCAGAIAIHARLKDLEGESGLECGNSRPRPPLERPSGEARAQMTLATAKR